MEENIVQKDEVADNAVAEQPKKKLTPKMKKMAYIWKCWTFSFGCRACSVVLGIDK